MTVPIDVSNVRGRVAEATGEVGIGVAVMVRRGVVEDPLLTLATLLPIVMLAHHHGTNSKDTIGDAGPCDRLSRAETWQLLLPLRMRPRHRSVQRTTRGATKLGHLLRCSLIRTAGHGLEGGPDARSSALEPTRVS